MNPEQAYGIAQYLIPMIEDESATTRKVLAAVPDDGSDYKPDARSKSGAELAAHIAFTDIWFLKGILAGEFGGPEDPPTTPRPSEALTVYNAEIPRLIAGLKNLTGEQLAKPVTFYAWTHPMIVYFSWYLNHSIHHRGQLSAYLRAMGSRVPSIYGGSADEPFEMPDAAVSA
jgi:uncharacterized damage-inducible protein DinB